MLRGRGRGEALEHGKRHRKPVVRKDTDMTQTTEHKKITPGDEEFWSERGIDFHVRLARPYVRYYPDDTTPVQDAYATLRDRKSTRLNSSHQIISYAVFCLKKKKKQ